MEETDKLKEVAERSYGKLVESATFCGICTEDYIKDPVCLIQFALSVFMDKPIFLLFQKGTKLSKNLIRLLDGYEFYEPGNEESFKEAATKLFEKIKKRV